jgi:hypothetical protein
MELTVKTVTKELTTQAVKIPGAMTMTVATKRRQTSRGSAATVVRKRKVTLRELTMVVGKPMPSTKLAVMVLLSY